MLIINQLRTEIKSCLLHVEKRRLIHIQQKDEKPGIFLDSLQDHGIPLTNTNAHSTKRISLVFKV